LEGHTGTVTSVAFSPDGKRIVSGSDDKTMKVWDASIGQANLTLEGHARRAMIMAFSPDGKRIVSAGMFDKTLKVWDASLAHRFDEVIGDSLVTRTQPDQRELAWQVRAQAWQRKEAESSFAAGEWFAARFHYHQIHQDQSDKSLNWFRLGMAH